MLLGGCAESAPPLAKQPLPRPPATPEAVDASPTPVSWTWRDGEFPDPPNAASGLGQALPLAPAEKARLEYHWSPREVTFGKGVALIGSPTVGVSNSNRDQSCVVRDERGGCRFLLVGRFSGAAPVSSWGGQFELSAKVDWSGFVPAPVWSCISPGKNGVWAVRKRKAGQNQKAAVDVIQADGTVREVVSLDGLEEFEKACVVVTASGPQLIVGHGPRHQMVRYRIQFAPGTPGKLADKIALPFFEVDGSPWHQKLARGRRAKPLKGWAVAHDVTTQGTLADSFLLVWDEATGPASPCPRVISCNDDRIPKRGHVTRLSIAGKQLGDHSGAPWDISTSLVHTDYGPMHIQSRANGIRVSGGVIWGRRHFLFDHSLKTRKEVKLPKRRRASEIVGPSPHFVVRAAFESKIGEGLVLLSTLKRAPAKKDGRPGALSPRLPFAAVRFDSLGRKVGRSWQWPANTIGSAPLAWSGGGWVTLDDEGVLLVRPSGTKRLFELAAPGEISSLHRVGRDKVLAVEVNPRGHLTGVSVLDVRSQKRERCLLLGKLSAKDGLRFVGPMPGGEDGSFVVRGDTLSVQRCAPGGKLEEIAHPGVARANALLSQGSNPSVWSQPVWDDTVLVVRTGPWRAQVSAGVWLRGGGEAKLPSAKGAYGRHVPSGGPLYPRLQSALPAAAGPLLDTRSPRQLPSSHCPFAFATGKRRVVLVCNESLGRDEPSLRVTTRTLRY